MIEKKMLQNKISLLQKKSRNTQTPKVSITNTSFSFNETLHNNKHNQPMNG